jgi:hypothetical protein
MFITIHKKRQKNLQWYIDLLIQQGWKEVYDFYSSNPSIKRRSHVIRFQKLI